MRVEVLCTGDELLTGLTADTNSPYFMGKLLALGEQVRQTTVVGDDRAELVTALRTVSARADLVLVSGGLGPTSDDLTAECAAQVAGVPLEEHAGARAHLDELFAKRGLRMSPNNLKQALVPRGSEVVLNPVGSAPMFVLAVGRATLMFVPGVPREYRALVDQQVLPRIAARLAREPERVFRAFRMLRTVGLPESQLDARVAPLAKLHPHVIFGFRTQAPENHLKLLAEGKTQAEADQRLAAVEAACRAELGAFVFGSGDDSFAAVVGELLALRKETLALAESCTGGRVADLLAATPGASRYFLGSAVTYANSLKERWVSVKAETLAAVGAVSEGVAVQMADGARAQARSTWGIGITGVAGPDGGSAEKPVGTVFIALAGPGRATVAVRHQLAGDRELIRSRSAYAALEMLRRALQGLAP